MQRSLDGSRASRSRRALAFFRSGRAAGTLRSRACVLRRIGRSRMCRCVASLSTFLAARPVSLSETVRSAPLNTVFAVFESNWAPPATLPTICPIACPTAVAAAAAATVQSDRCLFVRVSEPNTPTTTCVVSTSNALASSSNGAGCCRAASRRSLAFAGAEATTLTRGESLSALRRRLFAEAVPPLRPPIAPAVMVRRARSASSKAQARERAWQAGQDQVLAKTK